MKRGKKLIRNICIIAVLLCGFYYFGGFYLSKEECVRDTIRGLYGNENEVIAELRNKRIYTTIVINEEMKTASVVGTKKYGPFYHTASSFVGMKMSDSDCIDVDGCWTSERGNMVLVVYRNNQDIAKVEASLEDGSIVTVDEWTKDFAVLSIETEDWLNGTYKAYDSAGNLIGEVEY